MNMQFNRMGIAKRLILAEKFEQAKKLLLPLAKKNNSTAQLLLGYLFYGGDPNTSSKEAEYWLKKSAKNGNPEAMTYIATTNFSVGGWSSEAESSKSFSLLLKAAKLGSADAQRSLACSYAHGDIVAPDVQKTMYWDEQAAKQGLAESQNDLALMLLCGESGSVDIPKAIFWYKQSASKEHNVPYAEWAAEALARIYSGEPDNNYRDNEQSQYWANRAKYLSKLNYRSHPDWFYK